MSLITFRLKSVLKILLSASFLLLLLTNPQAVSSAAKEGLSISLYLVLPSVFPFAVISTYICSCLTLPSFITKPFSRLTGISENGAAPFLMGIISGYPTGALLISESFRRNQLSKSECEHLLPFANAAGPLFITGVAGVGLFGSVQIGYFLYFIHLLSIYSVMLLFRFPTLKSNGHKRITSPVSLIHSVDKAMNSMINVIGCIVFFSVICKAIDIMGIFVSPVPSGILELTNGLNRLALSDLPLRLKLSLASFFCGFSGLCILLQIQSCVKDLKLSLKKYVMFKLCIAFVGFILTWLLYPYLPVTVPTFSQSTPLSTAFLSSSYTFILFFLPLYKGTRRLFLTSGKHICEIHKSN